MPPVIHRPFRHALRLAPLAGLALFTALITGPQVAAQERPAGPIIELPKLVVTDNRALPPPESWRYADIPGFEILTNASDRSTQQLLRDFGIFRQALGMVMPIPTSASAPTMLILCDHGNKFEEFVPSGKSTVEAQLASLFLTSHEQSAIIIDLGTKTLNLATADTTSDATTGTDSNLFSVDHDKQLYREYVHFLLSRSDARPPAWLEEGMAQIIMAMKVDKTSIIFGQIEDANTVSAAAGQISQLNALTGTDDPDGAIAGAPAEDRDFNAALGHQALVPLQEFFTLSHDSPTALNPLGNNRWAKQAYAFVHMCLYGRDGRYQKPFALFLRRLGKEAPSEALFTACFKMSYRNMLDELRGYIKFTDYKDQEAHVKLAEPPPLVLRDATQAEVGRIKGEALLLAAHPEKARVEFTTPYIRGERDPRLLASLGIFEHTVGEDDHAGKFLDAAIAAKVERPAAYLTLAQIRYAAAMAKPGTTDGDFSPTQTAQVLAPLLVARQQQPQLQAVYELIGDTWSHSAMKPKKEDVAVLVEGVRLFPTRLRMLYQTAVFAADTGMDNVAGPLVDYALQVAPDAKTKAVFEKLKATLPPTPGKT